MRFTVLAAAIALAASAAPSASETADGFCPAYGSLASEIMTGRQAGIVMSKMMTHLKQDDPTTDKLIASLIRSAYAVPRFSTEEYRERAALDFQNENELACYNMIGETL